MTIQPLTLTTSVPHGKVSPKRRATTPDMKNRAGVPTAAPSATSAPPINSSDKCICPLFAHDRSITALSSCFLQLLQIDPRDQHVDSRNAEADSLPDDGRQHHDRQENENVGAIRGGGGNLGKECVNAAEQGQDDDLPQDRVAVGPCL